MRNPDVVRQFVEPLISGDRVSSRQFLQNQISQVNDPRRVYFDVMWPAMEQVEKMYRADKISVAAEHMATRITRSLADQLQSNLVQSLSIHKRILISCADGESEELGAQMCADLFESSGWDVYFLGGGVPNDEILSLVGQLRPDILLVFGTKPQGVPDVRQLIDLVRGVDSNPTMNVMISGGVFNRADGLWKEVQADLFAPSAEQALEMAQKAEPRIPQLRIPGAPKKRRRRRRSPILAAAGEC